MNLLFTDLDGTLLDHHTYAWDEARPALERLRRLGVPWIMVSSKTRAEIEYWRSATGNAHPFIVENGGAAYVPPGCLADVQAIEWGTRYAQLVADLAEASRESGCRVHGFHTMSEEEVAHVTDLPLWQAKLARQREYDEPFLVLDEERAPALTRAIEARGRRWTRGGRFWHILGANDKALAVGELIRLYRNACGAVRTIGLGDGLNDAAFLNVVDVPVLIRSPRVAELQALVPRGRVTETPGPHGWNQAVLELVRSQVAP